MDKQTQVDGAVGSDGGGSWQYQQNIERVFLTYEQAVSLLPEGDDVHVQYNDHAGLFLGADWSRSEVLKLFLGADRIEVGGRMCRAMGHGICVFSTPNQSRPAFVSHNEAALNELELAASPAKAPGLSGSEGTADQSDSTGEKNV